MVYIVEQLQFGWVKVPKYLLDLGKGLKVQFKRHPNSQILML